MAMQRHRQWCSFNFSYRLNLFAPSQKLNEKQLVWVKLCWLHQKQISVAQSLRTTRETKKKKMLQSLTVGIIHPPIIFSCTMSTLVVFTAASTIWTHSSLCSSRQVGQNAWHIKTPDPNQQLRKRTCYCSGKILLTSPWPARVSWTLWSGIWSLGLYWATAWSLLLRAYCKIF